MSDENILIAKEDNIRRFWISFTTWFMDELPGMGILQAYYEEYDNIELAFNEWVIFEKRYDFTVMVNKHLSRFSIPYRLQNGRLIQQGYKTSYHIDKIVNYSMFERKIRYSEEMIISREYLDKKCALDYIIDALQFILSVQEGEKVIRVSLL